jgi:long-subunit acyl-CoA synthetase (AMP-forming)
VLVYTSGTTGNPKGVMLTHDNLMYGEHSQLKRIRGPDATTEDERIVSYLPLSHIAGFGFDVLSNIVSGFEIFFARPDAL